MEGGENLAPESAYGDNNKNIHVAGSEACQQGCCCGLDAIGEAKRQLGLAGPLIVVSILQNSIQLISVMFNGHLGELSLSSASLATSFASVTGFSVLLGMASALETLCGQAYGAKQYHLLGIHMQRAVLTLLTISIPLSVIWFCTSTILISLHQDHEISTGAGTFNRWMIPSLFAFGLLQCLNRFLQTQNIVFPMMISSGVTALLHTIVCWLLVYKFGLGIRGAALANNISYWFNVFLLAIYVKFSGACRHSWAGFSKDAFHDFFSFMRLAIPSAVMICFEYWSFEMIVLLSGLLKNPKLETSVLSISVNTMWMVYMVSVGLGGAISSRVSNELGAGQPQRARLALVVAIVVALSEGVFVGIVTILARHVWGKLFSNEKEVIRYVAKIMPLLALSDFLDGFQCVLSGAARGCGWQKLCAFINLGAYYVVAIPSAVLLAFFFQIGAMGLWIGIICGLSVQVIALITLIACTNWDNEAMKAVRRVQEAGRGIGIETESLLSEEFNADQHPALT
ncbi:MATE efflux family protein DTX1 [Morus notabilis]|uniref:Protein DETOXIFICATION n=2 Tax=Morus notabilis TaxID=981085 RepID=W9RR29_9ROSA|nr:MATE efflux family protein DTX1 [Morus notabilis]